ncbi:hypothetical protein GLYMA_04G116250v4 [Glycine max]|nr:hypothetical protein GLYMA_04G116250v4 [Glycine max]KAH1110929.1 hypothetical protein GYH30_009645 [Glycine max]
MIFLLIFLCLLAFLTIVESEYLTKIQLIHMAKLMHVECKNTMLVFLDPVHIKYVV